MLNLRDRSHLWKSFLYKYIFTFCLNHSLNIIIYKGCCVRSRDDLGREDLKCKQFNKFVCHLYIPQHVKVLEKRLNTSHCFKTNFIDKCIGIPPVCRGSRWISLGTRVSGTRSQSCTAVARETVKYHPEKRNSPPFRYPEERACRIARPFIYIFTIIER